MEGITLFDWINLICNIVMAGCTIISLYTIKIAYKEYVHNRSKESAEKAIQMAAYFMDNILTDLSIVNEIFNEEKITQIIGKRMFYDLVEFDREEMTKLYDKKDIDKLKAKMKSLKIKLSKGEVNSVEIPVESFLAKTLNKLEYMCMNLSSGLADDEYIYNSLHQVFINSMQLCYYFIASRNISNKDKYYTNIISVYNKWAKKYYDAQENEEFAKEMSELRKEELNKKVKEITKPIIKKIKK